MCKISLKLTFIYFVQFKKNSRKNRIKDTEKKKRSMISQFIKWRGDIQFICWWKWQLSFQRKHSYLPFDQPNNWKKNWVYKHKINTRINLQFQRGFGRRYVPNGDQQKETPRKLKKQIRVYFFSHAMIKKRYLHLLTASLPIWTEGWLILAIMLAVLRVSSTRSSTGTTLLTRPKLRASFALKLTLPVKIISIALDLPTALTRRWVPPAPGITPNLISGWPKTAFSPA